MRSKRKEERYTEQEERSKNEGIRRKVRTGSNERKKWIERNANG